MRDLFFFFYPGFLGLTKKVRKVKFSTAWGRLHAVRSGLFMLGGRTSVEAVAHNQTSDSKKLIFSQAYWIASGGG